MSNLSSYPNSLESCDNVQDVVQDVVQETQDVHYAQNDYGVEIRNFQINVNFILDDILNAYYPGNAEELNLHKKIAETYNPQLGRQLYDLISAKTPYKRVWDIFLEFRDLLSDFIAIIDKIKAMDRIHKQRQDTLKEDLRSSFNEEYYFEIDECVNVAKNISKMALFFEYFVPNNDRILDKIFSIKNLQKLYIDVNNILHICDQNIIIENNQSNGNTASDIYVLVLEEIRKIDSKDLHYIVHWKYLQKRLKKYYPTSIIWYSKKIYYDLVHELIDILEKYQKYKETSPFSKNGLKPENDCDMSILHPPEKKRTSLLRKLSLSKSKFSRQPFVVV